MFAVHYDCLCSYRKAVVGKVVRDARMILDIPRHHLLVTFKKGRIVQRVTNKHILEHPEQPLWSLCFDIKWTFNLSSIIVDLLYSLGWIVLWMWDDYLSIKLILLQTAHLLPLRMEHSLLVADLNRCYHKILATYFVIAESLRISVPNYLGIRTSICTHSDYGSQVPFWEQLPNDDRHCY